jgi:hypothetical protein
MPSKLAAIHLNDHLAAGTAGAALAQRAARSCRRRAASEAFLA